MEPAGDEQVFVAVLTTVRLFAIVEAPPPVGPRLEAHRGVGIRPASDGWDARPPAPAEPEPRPASPRVHDGSGLADIHREESIESLSQMVEVTHRGERCEPKINLRSGLSGDDVFDA